MTNLLADPPSLLSTPGPGWLEALRARAIAKLALLPPLTGREEAWRYTDLSLLTDPRLRPLGRAMAGALDVPPPATRALAALSKDAAGVALLLDGAPVRIDLFPAAPQGITFLPLDQAARERPELLEPRLGSLVGPEDLFTTHSLALHRGGIVIEVPAGVIVAQPLHLLHWLRAEGAAVDTRVVVVLGEGASLTVQEHFASRDLATPTRAQPVAEAFVGPGASLTWAQWQSWGRGVRHLGHLRAHVEERGRLTTFLAGLGADFARTHHGVVLAGPGAEADLLGAYFPGHGQHHEHWTTQEHAAPRTRSDLLYKGALGGDGRSVYYGTIRVAPHARRSDAYQANRNLLLDPRAHADTNPQLEIQHNDVRCTHGATVGQVDEAQLFYLMSRGLSRPQAERLVVAGFFAEVVARLGLPGAEERLAALVAGRLADIAASESDSSQAPGNAASAANEVS